jgi:hypothetical protein
MTATVILFARKIFLKYYLLLDQPAAKRIANKQALTTAELGDILHTLAQTFVILTAASHAIFLILKHVDSRGRMCVNDELE